MKKKLALNYLMSQPWALDAQLLSLMGDIANRDADSIELDDLFPAALEGKAGKAVTPGMEKREGGVALIHVNGVISRYASMFHAICGGTATQMLGRDFTQAMNDSSVKSIVLYIDSPGGEADGIHEFSEMVYQARGKKPIVAYVGGSGCSAAYWIATAADEVVMDATARVGSIGTVMTIRRRKASEDDSIETLEIVSSQSPNKRLDPGTDEGRAAYQQQLDELADVFIDRVARNMGVSRDTVLSDFGGGGVKIGQTAVDKGMAHRLGSLESVIAELKKGKKTNMTQATKPGASGESDAVTLTLPTAEELSASDLVAALTEHRPDAISALKGPDPETALAHAADIAQQCAAAGLPALSATLLKEGVTKASAESTINMAKGLKDTLAAAGLSGSFDTLVGCIDDPVKMVGKAIHEAKAEADENGDQTRQIMDKEKPNTSLSAKDIYAKRQVKTK
ncbi:hypothetical protein BCS83_02260 [Vibrio splendidus]|nr:hypothetical protein BCS83_02260 [Vibrio splendidus]